MKSQSITDANKNRSEAGKKAFERLKTVCQNPMKENESLLLKIIRDNEDTEYGKSQDFKGIRTIEDFQAKVPVTTYNDYSEYIKRMYKGGEESLICSYAINHYNGSSGTTGDIKYIPMSDKEMELYREYVINAPFGIALEYLGDSWTVGRCIRLIEGTSEEYILPCGASFGALTGKMTEVFKNNIANLFTSPEEAIYPQTGVNTRYLHALFALMDEDATGFQSIYLSLLVVTLRYIKDNWEMLCNDIENGAIDSSIEIPSNIIEHLKKKISPMPERAKELREIFQKGFDEPFVPKVWKNLRYVIGVGTGGFKAYSDLLINTYLGEGIPIIKFGVVASEGCFTSAYRLNSEDTVLIPDSVFFEFLPIDAGDDFSKIVTLDGVESGKEYELIVTTTGGLYRYRMRDAVRVVGRFENTPTIEILYRIDQTVNILGEKTTEAALREAVGNATSRLGIELADFSVYGDLKETPPRYQFFLEIEKEPKNITLEKIKMVLEEELFKVAKPLEHLIESGVCQSIKVNLLQEESYALWRDIAVFNGASINQVKPVHIIRTENQKRFFFGLTKASSDN